VRKPYGGSGSYLDDLTEQAARFGCAIHSYVLMTNHVRLLLTPARPDSAALMMTHLGQRWPLWVWVISQCLNSALSHSAYPTGGR
jgi:hypothetical protein